MTDEEFIIFRKQVMLGMPKAEARSLAATMTTYVQPWSRPDWDTMLHEEQEE